MFYESVFVKLQLTEKVLAKCGLLLTESSKISNRSRYFFHVTNLQKICEMEK